MEFFKIFFYLNSQEKLALTPSAKSVCLRRNFNGNTPDAISIMILLLTPHTNFTEYENALRVNFHNNVHGLINGTMGGSYDAANVPVCPFFMLSPTYAAWPMQWNPVNTAINGPEKFGGINGVAVLTE